MEKRSIERHLVEEFIHLDGGEGIIPARTVDVSRNGMRVVVNRPHGFNEIQRVSVSLPGGSGGIPCMIRRSRQGGDLWEIGLEFDGENDARMLLVERWLESLEKRRGRTESAPTESRQVPRTRCRIEDIRCTNPSVNVRSVIDISADGMLLEACGNLDTGDRLDLILRFKKTDRELPCRVKVAYVLRGSPDEYQSVGVRLDDIRETDRNRLQNYIVDIASGSALLEYHRLLEKGETSDEFRVGKVQTTDMIRKLADSRQVLNLLDSEGMRIIETRVESIVDDRFSIAADAEFLERHRGSVFFSFTCNSSNYSFSAKSSGRILGRPGFQMPESLFRGEKRSGRRQQANGEQTSSPEPASLELDKSGNGPISARLMDSSRRGALIEVPLGKVFGNLPSIGQAVNLMINGEKTPGEIRHLGNSTGSDGEPVLKIGIEVGIRRQPVDTLVYSSDSWAELVNEDRSSLGNPDLLKPRSVTFCDRNGRRITGLVHITSEGADCIGVIIPPAFGKKKEVLAPLALTLMSHFIRAGENVAVLRYDGIDRPGESDNSNIHARRGYEMLGYRIDQGYIDLEAGMRWMLENDLFRATRTVVVSFSMSALDARRLQSTSDAPRADYWISVMGVSSAQGALRNILGGLDVIASHRMGLPIGTMGMMGQLIDMDRVAADMTRLGYATVSDARESMAKIDGPVTWIFGSHDKWMIPAEIRDIMSIASSGNRQIIEVPTAHNLRNSDDALIVFQLISSAILRQCTSKQIPATAPDRDELLSLLTYERERILETPDFDTRSYWRGYLIGECKGDEGYDFYRRLVEFRDFLNKEASLLDPRPGQSIADLGCGTGLVSEAIVLKLAEYRNLKGTRFTAVDLVNEALDKAREKYGLAVKAHPQLEEVTDQWLVMDLETDPLKPIRELLRVDGADFSRLKGRVRGLRSDVVDRLTSLTDSSLAGILRGERITAQLRDMLDSRLIPGDLLVLDDLNRAARYLRMDLDEEDLRPNRRRGTGRIRDDRARNLTTSDLHLSILDFGDWDRSGRIPIADAEFDAISASLLLSYLFSPEDAVAEFSRMLKPGGRLLISSMKPDSDISGIFTKYISEQCLEITEDQTREQREKNVRDARAMLNEAAALFSLEEDGLFRFFNESEMIVMMRNCGFTDIRSYQSLGNPAQAVIITGKKV